MLDDDEQWKPIIIESDGTIYDYTGYYQISNYGRVRSLSRIDARGHTRNGKIMRITPGKRGYAQIQLCKDGEKVKFYIHRLVATMFIPNPDNLPCVNHKDENKTNNNVENLEWCTQEYNVKYGTSRKRTAEKLVGKPLSDEHKQRISEMKKGKKNQEISGHKHYKAKKVICLETKQIFNTVKEAETWCGKGCVSNCCKGKQKTSAGYHWMYLEDYEKNIIN